jgi:hypothetical protein
MATHRSQPFLIIPIENFEFEFLVEFSGIHAKIIRWGRGTRNTRVIEEFSAILSDIRRTFV